MPSPNDSDPNLDHTFAPAEAPRQILVYAPLAYSTPHFETDLEIAQRHTDLGDVVDLVLCHGDLPSCQLNPLHEPRRCLQCVSRSLQGAAQLSRKLPTLDLSSFLRPEDHQRLAELPPQFASQQSLRNFRFESFDAGMATLSSIIDFARSLHIDTRRNSTVIHATLYAAVLSYLGMKRILGEKTYERVYIYNGRWSMMRSAVRACEALGVPYYTHERGSDFKKFALNQNTLPHDKDYYRKRVQATWETARAAPETIALAEAFFHDRRRHVEKKWFCHTKLQESGRVPADWQRTAQRIVFFTSSEFEFAAIGDGVTGRIYPGQMQATKRISRLLVAAAPDRHLWIRVHPNDKTSGGDWKEAVAGLGNVTLIQPEATTDSNALLDGADRVLTFGSTMGIEATFWGKPAICADYSFYDGLDAQYEPATEQELLHLLTCRDLPPKPRAHALAYGYYINTYGETFRHFTTDQISDYEFKSPFRGRCLKPDHHDLRQRLITLYHGGDLRRVATIAGILSEVLPDDGLVHSMGILSLLKLDAVPAAIDALEVAAEKAAPAQLEVVLKNTAKVLIDTSKQTAQRGSPATFQDVTRRIGAVMLRVAAFAAIGQKLIEMAGRGGVARPEPEATNEALVAK